VETGELAGRLGAPAPDPKLIARAESMGLIAPAGEGRHEVLSPALVHAGEELVRLGIPLEAGLKVQEQLNRYADGIARAFVRMFVAEVWEPFEAAGKPEADWPRVQEALDRVRPLALDAVSAAFRRSMTRAVEVEAARMVVRTGKASEHARPARAKGERSRRRRRG
jgi:hypothetical protein